MIASPVSDELPSRLLEDSAARRQLTAEAPYFGNFGQLRRKRSPRKLKKLLFFHFPAFLGQFSWLSTCNMSDFDENDQDVEARLLQRDDSVASLSSVSSSMLTKADAHFVTLENGVKMPMLGCTYFAGVLPYRL